MLMINQCAILRGRRRSRPGAINDQRARADVGPDDYQDHMDQGFAESVTYPSLNE
ncbi:hypothetical protein ACVWZZ_003335 [Bradyrhizobium sp. LM6.10]|jgi:hypothetical protein